MPTAPTGRVHALGGTAHPAAVMEAVEPRRHLTGDGPTFLLGLFEYNLEQFVQFNFDREILTTSASASDLQLVNLTTGQTVPSDQLSIEFTAFNMAVRFRKIGGVFADGNYTATLPAGSISDTGGNVLKADAVHDFFFLNADANRDRTVDLADFAILRINFGQAPRDFESGDFNYDTSVDLADFAILRAQFGKTLSAPDGRGLFDDGSSDDLDNSPGDEDDR